jgi:hypothetical protein
VPGRQLTTAQPAERRPARGFTRSGRAPAGNHPVRGGWAQDPERLASYRIAATRSLPALAGLAHDPAPVRSSERATARQRRLRAASSYTASKGLFGHRAAEVRLSRCVQPKLSKSEHPCLPCIPTSRAGGPTSSRRRPASAECLACAAGACRPDVSAKHRPLTPRRLRWPNPSLDSDRIDQGCFRRDPVKSHGTHSPGRLPSTGSSEEP